MTAEVTRLFSKVADVLLCNFFSFKEKRRVSLSVYKHSFFLTVKIYFILIPNNYLRVLWFTLMFYSW